LPPPTTSKYFKPAQSTTTNMFIPRKILEEKLLAMLTEDIGEGDVTTSLTIPPETVAEAEVICKEAGTVAGIEEAKTLTESLGLTIKTHIKDGDKVKPGQILLKIEGNARTILVVERTLLNIISRMSGIATATANMVERIRKSGARTRIACTRKTAPGLLYFDKKAVLAGGGDPHRFHLDDMILIKDNHAAIAGSVEKAVKRTKEKASFSKKIEVEVTKAEDILPAINAGADVIMLDNFSPERVEKAVALLKDKKLRGRVLLEVSGGITEKNLLEFASKGVDIISIGIITNSTKAIDISLEIRTVAKKRPCA
jgi:nicotinate-nucleotide pyrophosphorylase (carboxylating)